jgi:type VI secretion system secreted protein Hcp
MMKMKAIGLGVALVAVILFNATVSRAAGLEFYLSVTGVAQGLFKGEVVRKGFEGKIAGLSFDYELVSPRDAVSGMVTGKRQHKPIRIKKAWGPASAQFFAAQVRNEPLSIVMDFFMPDPMTGAMILDRTIRLTNATVVSFASHSDVFEVNTKVPPTDTIELTFQQIEITDHRSKQVVGDGLMAP